MNTTLFRTSSIAVLLGFAPALTAAAVQTERQYLSGRGKDDAVPWKFQCTSGALSGYWTNLPVPSQWDVHGFGTLTYKKDATNAWDERGLYERDFAVPPAWAGKRVFLVFEGVMTDTSARLNGQSAGATHQGGFYRFKYEVTGLLKFNTTNRLEVTVARHSANRSVNNAERLADYWVFGGIYRPAYLEAVPARFIDRVAIDARHDGTFTMDVFASGVAGQEKLTIDAQIIAPDGKPVGKAVTAGLDDGTPSSRAARMPAATIRTHIANPLAWSAETPNMYSVEVRLKQGHDVLHQIRQRFGFRTIEVRNGDGLYVNGRRVILKGVNRHSFWPDSGRCLSETVHRLDLQSIKEMNGNAVRMSHYPPDAEFLDLCDELGVYVLDELAGWHNQYDTDIGTKLVEEMVTRDVNHPSILFWDNGNEGGFNTNLDGVFAQFDPQQRRVLHPWAPFNGLCTAHYLAYDKAQIAASGQSVYFHNNQELVDTNDTTRYIYLPTEFQHGLFDGGGGAGMDDYWRMMMSHSNCAGGFVWVWTDDAVKRPDTGELDTAGNLAPDGIVGPYREREASFYTLKQIWSPIQVRRESDRTFTVENHYNFTDANQCRFVWRTRTCFLPPDMFRLATPSRKPARSIAGETAVARAVPSVPPGASGILKLDPAIWNEVNSGEGHMLELVVFDPAGREMNTWVWPMKRADEPRKWIHEPAPLKAAPTETTNSIDVTAGEFVVRISRDTGFPIRIERGARVFSLTNGPRPASGSATLTNLHFLQDGPDVVVSGKYSGALRLVSWRVCGNGWLQCEYQYSVTGTNDFFGVVFDYPENLVKHKTWLGNGPFRVWKNRLRGGTFGLWDNEYNNTITGWRGWVYPEFKGFFSDVRWLQLDTSEGPITVVPVDIPFVQVLTPEFPPPNLVGKTTCALPPAGLGFLHGIPPVGSKFKAADQTGPQGQPNIAQGAYSGTVSFYFGTLQ